MAQIRYAQAAKSVNRVCAVGYRLICSSAAQQITVTSRSSNRSTMPCSRMPNFQLPRQRGHRGRFQAVGYDVSYRRRGDSQWIRVASLGHGWLSPTSGRDTVPISLPGPGVYSIGVRMNSGILKWTYATIVSTTEQPYERAFRAPAAPRRPQRLIMTRSDG